MSSKVQMNVTFNIRWTIKDFLSLTTKRDYLFKSPYYKTGYGTTHEARWQFLVYPCSTTNPEEEHTIEIHTIVQSREEKYPGVFTVYVLGSENEKYALANLTQDSNSFTLLRSFLETNSSTYLSDNNLKILCTTSSCDLPYYWNMESKMLLCKDLSKLRTRQEDCDITIVAQGNDGKVDKEIRVHKCILCARNSVFRAMFDYDTSENRRNRIKIPDVKFNTLKVILDYIYCAEYDFLDVQHAMDVYIAADKYLVRKLKHACVGYLRMHLCTDNLKMFLDFSKYFNENELLSAATAYFRNHRDRIKDPELISFCDNFIQNDMA